MSRARLNRAESEGASLGIAGASAGVAESAGLTGMVEAGAQASAVRNTDPSGKAGQIAVELERRLLLGEYRFGQALSSVQLAKQFDASRQPVSVAISHLRSSGYVEVIPQVGCREIGRAHV